MFTAALASAPQTQISFEFYTTPPHLHKSHSLCLYLSQPLSHPELTVNTLVAQLTVPFWSIYICLHIYEMTGLYVLCKCPFLDPQHAGFKSLNELIRHLIKIYWAGTYALSGCAGTFSVSLPSFGSSNQH